MADQTTLGGENRWSAKELGEGNRVQEKRAQTGREKERAVGDRARLE